VYIDLIQEHTRSYRRQDHSQFRLYLQMYGGTTNVKQNKNCTISDIIQQIITANQKVEKLTCIYQNQC
jgi:hypothetical protein